MDHPEKSLQQLLVSAAHDKGILPSLKSFVLSSSETLPAEATHFLLQLLKTSSIPSQVQAVGIPPETMRLLSDTRRLAHELRDACVPKMTVTPEKTKALNDTWTAAHAEQARAWAEDAMYRARDAIAKTRLPRKKHVFNHEYTPLLEKYFEHNAYPSAPDRAVLARKCMMTLRQIEVWFQNHRNRAKKEGKTLRKLTEESLKINTSFISLEDRMPLSTTPSHEPKPTNDVPHYSPDEDDIIHANNHGPGVLNQFLPPCLPMQSLPPTQSPEPLLKDPFYSHRPPHAFPTVYSSYESEHERNNFKFASPTWPRKCSAVRCTKIQVDMDEFIRDFGQKLHLRGPMCKNRHSGSTRSWCATRTVVPCPAPLPALVRLSALSQSLPESSTKITIPRVAISSSQPGSLISNTTPYLRTVIHLPKRSPNNSSITSHPPQLCTEKSLFNHPVPTYQLPFFGSNSSSRRSSFSSSDSSSGPTTPVQSSASLLQDRVNKGPVFSPGSQNVEDDPRRSTLIPSTISLNVPLGTSSKDV